MKKIISLILVALMLLSSAVTAGAASLTEVIISDGLLKVGDFGSLTEGFIVYAPAALTASEEKYPVAVWANGTYCAPVLYSGLLKGVARSGYIVVASPEMMSGDGKMQIAAIDWILSENSDEGSIFCGKVDTGRIAAFGQSQGGQSCVNAAAQDSRISAVVSIAGASTARQAGQLRVPTLFLTGTEDWVVEASEWVEPSYTACTAPAVYASLKNGTHTSFISKADTYVNYTVKWFNAWLYEDGDKSAFLPDGELANDPDWTDFRMKNFNGEAEGTVEQDSDGGIITVLRQLFAKIRDFFKGIFG